MIAGIGVFGLFFSLTCLLMATAMAAKQEHRVDPLGVPEAIARYELSAWRKTHPKADLSVMFFDHELANAEQAELRKRLGFTNPKVHGGADLLLIQFGVPQPVTRHRGERDASVFYGQDAQAGFRAHYVVRTAGGTTGVSERKVLFRY